MPDDQQPGLWEGLKRITIGAARALGEDISNLATAVSPQGYLAMERKLLANQPNVPAPFQSGTDVPSPAMPLSELAQFGAMHLAGGAPRASLSSGMRAPTLGRGSEAPLFDYSRLAEQPNVPQFDLPRATAPKGIPAHVQALADPANMARVNAAVQQGIGMGGPEWYGTQPLRERFVGELGEEEGGPAFQRYIDYIAATSPLSRVPANIRNASYYYARDLQGQPPPELVPGERPGSQKLAAPPPSPYGHAAQIAHARNVRDIMERGGWNPLQNPKPASFAQNLAGNWQPLTIDRHNARLLGLANLKGQPLDLPMPGHYGYLEDIQQAEAAKMGLAPAQYQASAWLGGGGETGLGSAVEPFLKTFEDRVRFTAQKRGESPNVTLSRFIRGEAPLLSIAGAGVGATLGALSDQLASSDEPPSYR